jgi:archaeal flagellar protein FlaI
MTTQTLQRRLLPHLRGKLHLYQSDEERQEVIDRVLVNEPVFGDMSDAARQLLARDFLALDPVQEYVEDPQVEDIMINGTSPVYVYHEQLGMVQSKRRFETVEELEFFVEKMLVLAGKNEQKVMLDLQLFRHLRVNIVNSPYGPQITIRRMKEIPPSIIDLVSWKTLDFKLAAELWLYSDGLSLRPANLFVGGAPGSGKTTLLNAMFSFFGAHQRIVTIEDTLELNTNTAENCARLEVSETASAEELVKNSLRMRPDRIVVGEVRGAEARHLLTSMNIGACCMGTIHTDTARNIITRLHNTPMNIPIDMIALLDVLIVVRGFNEGGRTHRAVVEVVETGGIEGNVILLSEPQIYNLAERRLAERGSGRTLFRDRLSRASGKSGREILDELKQREKILSTLAELGIHSMPHISQFIRDYYENPRSALEKIGMTAG